MNAAIASWRRPVAWMTLQRCAVVVVAMAGMLVASAVACPIITSSLTDYMPCSESGGNSPQCPFAFYVGVPDARTDVPPFAAVPVAMVPPDVLWHTPPDAEFEVSTHETPPGSFSPLFLQTHCLLI